MSKSSKASPARVFTEIFLQRPKLSMVLSLLFVLAGLVAIPSLPVSQFPDITPPTVTVFAQLPGANVEVIEESVANPIEDAVNGVEDMLYMNSRSTSAGTYNLEITFAIGTDPDIAQVNVQNRMAMATPQLPTAVVAQGVRVQKASPDLLMMLSFTSDGSCASSEEWEPANLANLTTCLLRTDTLLPKDPIHFSVLKQASNVGRRPGTGAASVT